MEQSAARKPVSHAGDITPAEAWLLLKNDPSAQLVDVRTDGEWAAGIPDLASLQKRTYLISWRLLPSRELNAQFTSSLQQQIDRQSPVLFLCKSGGRSHEAALEATAYGYKAYNIAGGFEADTGWRASGLPHIKP